MWLGNVDDFVPRKDLESLLSEFGRLVNGMRYLPARTCAFASFTDLEDAILARNALYGLEVQRNQYLNVDFVEEADQQWNEWGSWGQQPMGQPWGGGSWGAAPRGGPGGDRRGGRDREERQPWIGQPPSGDRRRGSPMRLQERSRREARRRSRSPSGRRSDREASPRVEKPRKRQKRVEASPPPRVTKQAARSDSEEQPPQPAVATKGEKTGSGKAKVKLYKMREFCCNIVANFVKGREQSEAITTKLHIDQRTKIEHCRAHMDRAGALATIWHFSAADRRDCAAYDALCDYFVEKGRVGLVQTPGYYVYIVPPTEKYLKDLNLPTSNFVVGVQIPIKK